MKQIKIGDNLGGLTVSASHFADVAAIDKTGVILNVQSGTKEILVKQQAGYGIFVDVTDGQATETFELAVGDTHETYTFPTNSNVLYVDASLNGFWSLKFSNTSGNIASNPSVIELDRTVFGIPKMYKVEANVTLTANSIGWSYPIGGALPAPLNNPNKVRILGASFKYDNKITNTLDESIYGYATKIPTITLRSSGGNWYLYLSDNSTIEITKTITATVYLAVSDE